jgi:asparagine synthase (glutamine-hydrolysing)
MCGIAGILRFDGQPVDPAALDRMRSHLSCRGPDEHGVFIDGPLGLAHTRLAILDPSHGAQPMLLSPLPPAGEVGGPPPGEGASTHANNSSPPNLQPPTPNPSPPLSLAVTFNGEIYNHRTLRTELQQLGHRFATDHCDTEVLLHGYRQWGVDLPIHLDGMFAFALWDAEKQMLFLARDRAGKKPLYVRSTADQLVFASTVAALVGPDDEVDTHELLEYLAIGHASEGSLIIGVLEIPPAHRAIVTAGEEPRWNAYWELPEIRATQPAIDFVKPLRDAVVKRLEADVPLGCFLSGGIDSSVVAALAQEELKKRGQRLKTFSVSMPDTAYDEGPFAKRVAEHIGAEHHELRAEPDLEKDLQYLIATMGEPLGDSSLLPTYWLSRATRQRVTVALSGDGGDELFGGYDRYRAVSLIERHRWWMKLLPRLGGGEQKSMRSRLGRLIDAAKEPGFTRQYLSMTRLFGDGQIGLLGLSAPRVDEDALTPALSRGERGQEAADLARRWDFENYLPFDLLRKVDRASMAVGLEVRCPMLDTAVVELAMATPYSVLCPGGRPKGMLRDIARQWLPAEICDRKKMGFAAPIGAWFAGPLKPLLEKWLLDAPYLGEIQLRRDALERFITEHAAGKIDHAQRLFALLSLSMWLAWLKDPKPAAR